MDYSTNSTNFGNSSSHHPLSSSMTHLRDTQRLQSDNQLPFTSSSEQKLEIDNRRGNQSTKGGNQWKRPTSTCLVCGAGPCSYAFYGAVVCDSCRTFFRRQVLTQKPLRCLWGQKCRIDVKTRKDCAMCRFSKCLAVGMNPDLVTSIDKLSVNGQLQYGGGSLRQIKRYVPPRFSNAFHPFVSDVLERHHRFPHPQQQHLPFSHVTASLNNTPNGQEHHAINKVLPSGSSILLAQQQHVFSQHTHPVMSSQQVPEIAMLSQPPMSMNHSLFTQYRDPRFDQENRYPRDGSPSQNGSNLQPTILNQLNCPSPTFPEPRLVINVPPRTRRVYLFDDKKISNLLNSSHRQSKANLELYPNNWMGMKLNPHIKVVGALNIPCVQYCLFLTVEEDEGETRRQRLSEDDTTESKNIKGYPAFGHDGQEQEVDEMRVDVEEYQVANPTEKFTATTSITGDVKEYEGIDLTTGCREGGGSIKVDLGDEKTTGIEMEKGETEVGDQRDGNEGTCSNPNVHLPSMDSSIMTFETTTSRSEQTYNSVNLSVSSGIFSPTPSPPGARDSSFRPDVTTKSTFTEQREMTGTSLPSSSSPLSSMSSAASCENSQSPIPPPATINRQWQFDFDQMSQSSTPSGGQSDISTVVSFRQRIDNHFINPGLFNLLYYHLPTQDERDRWVNVVDVVQELKDAICLIDCRDTTSTDNATSRTGGKVVRSYILTISLEVITRSVIAATQRLSGFSTYICKEDRTTLWKDGISELIWTSSFHFFDRNLRGFVFTSVGDREFTVINSLAAFSEAELMSMKGQFPELTQTNIEKTYFQFLDEIEEDVKVDPFLVNFMALMTIFKDRPGLLFPQIVERERNLLWKLMEEYVEARFPASRVPSILSSISSIINRMSDIKIIYERMVVENSESLSEVINGLKQLLF